MSDLPAKPRILHVHASFDPGVKETRNVRLINEWGKKAEHAIVSGDPERRGAAAQLDRKAKVRWPKFPPLTGKPLPGRLNRIAAAMAGYDLICTYDWGAMDAAMAHTLFADVHKLPPLIHHEDGFDAEEAKGLKWRRNTYRRLALGRTAALVVPSHELERIALEVWQQPRSRVRRIANGIDTKAFAARPKPDILPGLIKRKGEHWVGTLTGLREVKDLQVLVRALKTLPPEWQLVIAGEGPEREAIEAEAERLGLEDRVHLPGFVKETEKLIGLFDIFALSSRSEQFPLAVVEAMAAGLPVVAPRLGDIGAMVASDNGPYLAEPGDEAALAKCLDILALKPEERARIGAANKARAREEYDAATMVQRYHALYWGVMGRRQPAAD